MSLIPNMRLSVLDPSWIGADGSASNALRGTVELAKVCDALDFYRFWVVEHHSMASVASAAPATLLATLAANTSSIRVGSGGVMLPNHPPLVVAEEFGTLTALHTGRIDLGIGRAPGTDPETARRLRRPAEADEAFFSTELDELLAYFDPGQHGAVYHGAAEETAPEFWILGTSKNGALEAARRGLRFAFAHHIKPQSALEAISTYRANFVPSQYLREPYVMVSVAALAAESSDEARAAMRPSLVSASQAHKTGVEPPFPTHEEATSYVFSDRENSEFARYLDSMPIGSVDVVAERLAKLGAELAPDEVMITCPVRDVPTRIACYQLLSYGCS